MQAAQQLTFGPYRFDCQTKQLWRSKQEVRLTKKASALLHYLLDRAGQVATKEELFAAVWSDTVVSDAALTSCIQELRQALRDDARKPRYIETVHRRGFRFIAQVRSPESQSPRQNADQEVKGENGLASGVQSRESNGQGFGAFTSAQAVPVSLGLVPDSAGAAI
jgi:DNA-binding winged helix-turn-helix (wHTH) protein